MGHVIAIDRPDDLRVADYRQLRERDLVGRQGRFIAEGEVVLGRLLTSRRCRPVSMLIDAKRIAGLAAVLDLAAPDVPVYAASQVVLDEIAGFHLHRGILALGERLPDSGVVQLLGEAPADAVIVVALGLSNHDNIGGVFRNAAAFGAHAVLLDRFCCDPLYRKAIRVSVGASLVLPWARWAGEAAGLLDDLAGAGFDLLALSPAGEIPLSELRRRGRTALLLGAEGPGLSAEVLSRARRVRIEMGTGLDSLNVATAGAVALHHLLQGAGRA